MTTTFGKYRVLALAGKGAAGVVYKSVDPFFNRLVALKIIREELLQDEDEASAFLERFRIGAQAASRLQHRSSVAVYECGEHAGCAFIAMEYVEGLTLRQLFERKIRFDEHEVVGIVAQLLDALEHMHAQGVWHRNIIPSNIIIRNDGRLKVVGFGLAHVEGFEPSRAVGFLLGAGIIAPEQYIGRQIDHRVDIFAAGVLLYELLTGLIPFKGPKEAMMYKICHEPTRAPSLAKGNPALARFDPIVLRALAKRPPDRYSSARDFLSALLRAQDGSVSETVLEDVLIRAGHRPSG